MTARDLQAITVTIDDTASGADRRGENGSSEASAAEVIGVRTRSSTAAAAAAAAASADSSAAALGNSTNGTTSTVGTFSAALSPKGLTGKRSATDASSSSTANSVARPTVGLLNLTDSMNTQALQNPALISMGSNCTAGPSLTTGLSVAAAAGGSSHSPFGGAGAISVSTSGIHMHASQSKLKDDEKKIQLVIFDINVQIATFRDLLIHIGTAKDAPELREKIRRVRRQCVEGCKQTNNLLLPQIKSAVAEGTILGNHQLICLYMLSQLLERELDKCLRLVVAIPMDMSSFYDNKSTTTHGLGNVLSQIVLGKAMKPDFDVEERASIEKDTREIRHIINEMAEYLPQEDPDKARNGLTSVDSKRRWAFKKKRKQWDHRGSTSAAAAGAASAAAGLTNRVSTSFCCLCSANYV